MSTYKQIRSGQLGFTLIELMVFIVIVSVAVLGVLRVISFTTANSADPQLRKQALVLAESMLEEVQLARYTFCNPIQDPAVETAASVADCTVPQNVAAAPSTADRPYYNVTDYARAFNAPVIYPQDASKIPFPAGYTVTVAVAPEAALGPAGAQISPADATPANMNALRITVVVTYGGNQSITLVGYRTRYAPNLI